MRLYLKIFIILILLLSVQPLSANNEPVLIGTIKSDTLLTLFGTRIIPLGDQNNDGFDDFLTWDFRFTNYLYYGGNPFDSTPALRFDSTNGRTSNLGDINGDNFDDFSALGRSQYGWKQNVYYGGPSIDTLRDLWFGDDTARAAGYTVHSQDIDNNGTDELISKTWFGGAVNLFELNQQNDTLPFLRLTPANIPYDGYEFGRNIISGDFNGDGIDDFAFSAIDGGNFGMIFIYSGWDIATDVAYEFEPNLPDNFTLLQNYPNPFNPSTTIEFQLPYKNNVTLKIYNSLGQEVRTLLNKELSAGSYKLEWDGKNAGGGTCQ